MSSKGHFPGKLNARKVETLASPGHYGDGGGLYLQISDSGTKSWSFRYRGPHTRHEMGLGKYPTVSLLEARLKASEFQKQRIAGLDPLSERMKALHMARLEAARLITFQECAQRCIAANRPKWRSDKHAKQWMSTLEHYAFPVFGQSPVQVIDHALVCRVLQPIWQTKAETASRLRCRIEAVLDWATVSGYRDGLNPARWKGNLKISLGGQSKAQRVKHHPSLPHKEIADFLVCLRQQKGLGASALEFLILTAARTNEVLGATWEEIDYERSQWRVPAQRMKAGKEHRVPLSSPAVALLHRMEKFRSGDLIFPGGKPGKPLSNMAMTTTLRRMERGDIVPHGFRSTFRNWAGENGFPREVAERALAHAVGNSVEAAYYTSDLVDQRRPLMDQWARYCSLPAHAVGDNVHRLKPAAAVA